MDIIFDKDFRSLTSDISEDDNFDQILFVSFCVLILCNFSIIFAYFALIYRRHKSNTESIQESRNAEEIVPLSNLSIVPENYQKILPSPDSWDSLEEYLIPNSKIENIQEKAAGKGFFSSVKLGEYNHESDMKKVAIKLLNPLCKEEDIRKEIHALRCCNHENIVSFIGWMRHEEDGTFSILTEAMEGGNLHEHLETNKNLKTLQIFSYINQVLDAMIYLSQMQILHRDLAARNCLLNKTFEILKVSDFGLARKMNIDDTYFTQNVLPLPFRWVSIETLSNLINLSSEASYSNIQQRFTIKGDIWSFGILVWEMFEEGRVPYGSCSNIALLNRFLKEGKRLSCPAKCPQSLYVRIMLSCWEKEPQKRPTFEGLKQVMEEIDKSDENGNEKIEDNDYEIPNMSQNSKLNLC